LRRKPQPLSEPPLPSQLLPHSHKATTILTATTTLTTTQPPPHSQSTTQPLTYLLHPLFLPSAHFSSPCCSITLTLSLHPSLSATPTTTTSQPHSHHLTVATTQPPLLSQPPPQSQLPHHSHAAITTLTGCVAVVVWLWSWRRWRLWRWRLWRWRWRCV
jgi:hypothetical protein